MTHHEKNNIYSFTAVFFQYQYEQKFDTLTFKYFWFSRHLFSMLFNTLCEIYVEKLLKWYMVYIFYSISIVSFLFSFAALNQKNLRFLLGVTQQQMLYKVSEFFCTAISNCTLSLGPVILHKLQILQTEAT